MNVSVQTSSVVPEAASAPQKALLTQSRQTCARTCQRKHHIQYELGYRAIVELGGRRFGTLMHKGLEAFWKGRQAGKTPDECLALGIAAMQGESDPFELIKAEVLLTGYAARWSDKEYEVLAVEVQFASELRNPLTGAASRTWELGGKIDVMVRERSTGREIIVEHKTSSEDITAGSVYWRVLRLDNQVSTYFAGAASLGYDPAECLYDVIGKISQRPSGVPIIEDGAKVVLDANGVRVRTKDGKKWRETADAAQGYVLQTRPETPDEFRVRVTEIVAADPDRYFARGTVVRIGDEMTDAMIDTWQIGQQIRENQIAGRHPRNPSACRNYGGLCDFFDVCSGAASLDDTSLFTQSNNVHPELSTDQPKEAQ